MLRPPIVTLFAVTLIGVTGWTSAAHRDEDAAVRAVLDAYLAMVTYPDPQPIDAEIFAGDIEVLWSDGETYLGRDAVADALAASVAKVAEDLRSFKAVAEDVSIRRKGDLAWLTCRVEFSGSLKKALADFANSVHSTFIFEKRDDRWLMVHEHSSRPPAPK